MEWMGLTTSRQEIYELKDNEDTLLICNYYPGSGIIRISSEYEKRVFLFNKEGFLHNKKVLRNEYGIKMAKLVYENGQENQGFLKIINETFQYSILKHLHNELIIYKRDSSFPEITCKLPSSQSNNDLLILSLGWYLFLSIGKKQMLEYA
jgi:hypothetical protein